ncbi:hypoxanthine phosphoribosyltransferase [Candidatus Ruminimicrobiellum ovillum]|uniref:hypoxanthine phosphoribosyltransferase n=1 Tax=Candidatus Ruminimicrobiellum ovillum TaxID=1947927 RepID=UPI00355A954E
MKKIKVLISSIKIKNKVTKIAQQINKDFKNKKLVVVSVLSGSVVFCSDIIRNLNVDFEIDFIRVASYKGKKSSGKIKFLCDVVEDIKGKDILLVEDICDSGRTLSYVKDLFIKRKANSVKICTLINKKVEKFKNIKIDYFGFEIDNEFIVGYGLDYDGKYRGLPYIGVI